MKVFGEFSEKKLPKDDLYYSIKNEIEAKEKELEKKKKKEKSHFHNNPNAPVLPTIHKDDMEKAKAQAHRQKVEQMIRELDQDPAFKAIGRPRTPRIVEDHKQIEMAFQGDFEKLDDEIKVQLKAIKNNDFKTIEKIHKQELTAEDQKIYLMSKDERKAIIQDYDDKYDSDLE